MANSIKVQKIPDIVQYNLARVMLQTYTGKRSILWFYDSYTDDSNYHGYRLDINGTSKTIKYEEINPGTDPINLISIANTSGLQMKIVEDTTPVVNTAYDKNVLTGPLTVALVVGMFVQQSNNSWYQIDQMDNVCTQKPYMTDTRLRFNLKESAYSERPFRAVVLYA